MRGAPVLATILVALFVGAAVLAPWIVPHNPADQNFLVSLAPPFWQEDGSLSYPLGSDNLGRDILSRIIYGARLSLIISVFAIALAGSVGVLLGLIAGYVGGAIDSLIMRIVDAFLALPFILMALGFVAALGPSVTNIIIVMGITNWARYARLVRGEVLSIKSRDFVALARVAGQPRWRIGIRHILPNVTNSIIVLATLDLGRVIILESSLSFLGLGVQPPDISWGLMLSDGRAYMTVAWWLTIMPGLAILLAVLSLNIFGDWMRDRLDPRQGRD
ncbi:ABC transporter permease [Siccirubricoccus deserti]|uniref:ABC transporter permease n=2 Tax=Siccirubricoccus deserti TaxID=2013562 RepID=A0A9X0UJW4_9PROT|nr:ABC transporter permease [Siccirubricoccus deserti]